MPRRWFLAGAVSLCCAMRPAGAQDGTLALVAASGDTIAVERFTRTPTRLEIEMLLRVASARFTMAATLAPDGTVSRFDNAFRQAGADPASPAAQTAVITFRGDSAIADITTGANTVTQRLGTRAGAMPFINPSFILVEQIVRRARVMGGASATVPAFAVQGGQTVTFTITWLGTDSALVDISGAVARLAVSAEGDILGGTVPAQGLRLIRSSDVRRDALTVAPPDYRAPAGAPYTAQDVEVTTPDGFTLAGTLTLPGGVTGPVPAVVTITGSGLQDRDAHLPLVRDYRLFRQVADTLSRRGLAVLRMDDRGFGASGGAVAGATTADFAADIRAGLAWLRQRPEIDGRRLGLVGHSEGGLIAPMIAAADTTLRAMVLMAAPGWTGRRVIEWQNRYVLERTPSVAPAARDSLLTESMRIVDSTFAHEPWGRFFASHDPLATARRVRATPVLILHGETDRQVTVEQAKELAAAFRASGNPHVTTRTFPGTNHLFLPDDDGFWGNYARLGSGTVGRDVMGALADWLATQLGAGR